MYFQNRLIVTCMRLFNLNEDTKRRKLEGKVSVLQLNESYYKKI